MDNLTHSLVGYALSEIADVRAPRLEDERARRAQRRLLIWTSVVAANLPDADLLFTSLTPEPLGYLLHHRGHTHTVLGLVPQLGVLLVLLRVAAPAMGWRGLGKATWAVAASVAAAGLLSHLLADAWNSYGVHPFHPLASRWFYGDAIFILEPVIWTVLLAVLASSRPARWLRAFLVGVVGVLCGALAWAGLVSPLHVVVLTGAAAVLAGKLRSWPPARRAAAGLALVALCALNAYGASAMARSRLLDAFVRAHPAETVHDLVMGPTPANPLCWDALAVSTSATSYTVRRAAVSLWPALVAPGDCPFARRYARARPVPSGGGPSAGGVLWLGEKTMLLTDLRAAYAGSCALRAWWRFGRVPDVGPALVEDLRFAWSGRDNFTRLAFAAWPGGGGCPQNVPGWTPPRADVLGLQGTE